MSSPRKFVAASALAALCLGLVGPPLAAASRPLGAESPEALARRLAAGAEAGDFGEVAACLEPGARAEMALGMVAATAMMMGFLQMGADMGAGMAEGMVEGLAGEEPSAEQKAEQEKAKAEIEKAKKEAAEKAAALQKRFEAVLARHQLSDLAAGAPMPGESTPEEAQKRLAGVDQVALLEDLIGVLGDLNPEAKESMKPSRALYQDITDVKVTGDTATARAGDRTLEMVKIDGRWYLKPTQGAPAGKPTGG